MVEYKAVFKDSLARVTGTDDGVAFFREFYDRFIAADAGIADQFKNTDMDRQITMLKESLEELMNFSTTLKSNNYIVTLARIHGVRGREVLQLSYDVWMDSLIETVGATDPNFDDNVALAWRVVLAPGIEFMKFYYDK